METPTPLLDLATAVADLTPIDWPALEAEAADPVSRAALKRLRLLDRIVRACAVIVPPGTGTDVAGQPDADAPPSTWGPLTIHERIGRGTFGDVYRAHDRRLDRKVALKLLKPGRADDEAAGVEVIREAQLLAKVRHPNVVTVYGAERIDGRVGMWMEFVDGRTLEDELHASGPLPPEQVIEVGLALCSALAAVHDAGLLHRDLKAQNVMRAADGRILLTDFGAGRARAGVNSEDTGPELAGTPLYLAPEVLNGAPASVASEIYSAGVLLYHLATGSFPVRGRTLRDLRHAHARGVRVSVGAYREKVPKRLACVIDRAVDRNPAKRFTSPQDLRYALLRCRRSATRALAWIGGPALAAVLVVAGLNLVWSLAPPIQVVEQRVVLDDVDRLDVRFAKGDRIYLERYDGAVLSMNPAQPALDKPPEADTWSQYVLIDISPTRPEYLALKKPTTPSRSLELWVLEIATGHTRQVGDVRCITASWAPNGSRIACVSGRNLLILNADGTGVRTVALPPGDASSLHWSPSGKRIRLTVQTRDRDRLESRVWEAGADGGGLRPLLAGWDTPPSESHSVWTPDGRYFVFTSTRAGRKDLWAVREPRSFVDWTPREPVQLTTGPMTFGAQLVAGSDGRIYTMGLIPKVELVQLDRRSGRFVRSLGGIAGIWVTWSPDRKSIAYVSFPDKKLWRADADGSNARQLLLSPVEVNGSRWSPDGKWISIIGRLDGAALKIFLVAADGSGSPQAISTEDKNQGIPSWSQDGRLCYGDVPKNDGIPDGNEALHIFDLATKRVSDVPRSEGRWSCRWSPDGRSLAATTILGKKLAIYNFKTQTWRPLPVDHVNEFSWSSDSTFIHYETEGVQMLRRVRVADGRGEDLATLFDYPRAAQWSGLTPDDAPITLHGASSSLYALRLGTR